MQPRRACCRWITSPWACRPIGSARTCCSTGPCSGVHHIAFACQDIAATVARLRTAGVAFLSIPDNYYLDLEARFGLTDDFVGKLREAAILYDRDDSGEYFHIFTETFAGRFFFEI